ncbi:hypothetical protein QM012_005524 [Aureobasidium pullulans]|uniref:Cryptic loci regulator 2 N-terminal domain-containing protein n=1 Tax=Aureobasidium pullulans TaxID=5580 RepID=A0ABR0T4Y0_AURPU
MSQGSESPLFCREDTPPRSGVPPGYVSIRPLLLQRQQSLSSQQSLSNTAIEDDAPPSETDAASIALDSDFAQETSLLASQVEPIVEERHEEEPIARDQVWQTASFARHHSKSQMFIGETPQQVVEFAQPQHGSAGHESSLFNKEDTPPRSGVPPGYLSMRSVTGRRARRIPSPVGRSIPAIPEESHGSHSRPKRTAPLAPPLRHRPSSYSVSTAPTPNSHSTQPIAQQQRSILPYVFQPSSVPQTPMESTLAEPLITKWQARSGAANYPKYSPVTTTTTEGVYTLTDAQVYWNARGRPQCFKIGCDNNQGIGYSTGISRDEHIANSRFHKEVSHLWFEQTKRGHQNGRDYPLL